MLGEIQVADAVGLTFPDGHRGEECRAAVPQPLQLIVPQSLQQRAEPRIVLLMKVVVVAVRVEVETPERVGAKAYTQLDGPLHERPGALLKAPSRQLLHLRLRHIHVGFCGQLPRLLAVDIFLVPVAAPLRPPELPVNDRQASEVLSRDVVVDVLVGLEQVQVQAAVLGQAAVHRLALWRVVGVVAQSVGIEDGDVLASPLGARASLDVEETVDVGGDFVLDGAQVHRGIPRSDEGLPTQQGQLGWFLAEGSVKQKEEPRADEGDGHDVLGGGCPAHWHHRHPGVQKGQPSVILKTNRQTAKNEEKSKIYFLTPTSNFSHGKFCSSLKQDQVRASLGEAPDILLPSFFFPSSIFDTFHL